MTNCLTISEDRETLTIGAETRPLKHHTHAVSGYRVERGNVVRHGSWTSTPWTEDQIRNHSGETAFELTISECVFEA